MNKVGKFILKLVVSLAFIAWLVFEVEWGTVWEEMQRLSLAGVGLYVAVLFLGMLISAGKWRTLAAHKGIDLPLFDYFKYYLGGTFVNNYMPSFIGGDTFRAYQVGKRTGKMKEAASSVVADRVAGLVGALLLTLVFFAVNFRQIIGSPLLLMLELGVGLALLIFFGLISMKKFAVWKRAGDFLPQKIKELVIEITSYADHSQVLSKAVLWSMLFGLVGLAATNYVLFWVLGIEVNVWDYLSVIFLVSVVSSLPVSINNIGIKEWAYVTFFGFFGVPAASVITVAIVSRVLQMLVSFLALPVYLHTKK